MTRQYFQDDCPGCRPALAKVDKKTKKVVPLSKDHPTQVEVERVWDEETTFEQRAACHSVWCDNSKDLTDLDLCSQVALMMQTALKKLENDGKI